MIILVIRAKVSYDMIIITFFQNAYLYNCTFTYFFIADISTPEVAGNIFIAYSTPVYLCRALDTLPYEP